MLREMIEDALSRGERLKKDIVQQVLSSSAWTEIVNSRRFADTIARVIQTKDEVSRSVHRNVVDALRMMRIPSKEDIALYEKRLNQLERQIDSLGRQVMKKGLKARSSNHSRTRRKKR